MSRPLSENIAIPAHHCPYLGLADDRTSFFADPDDENLCHCPSSPEPIALHHQRDYCLTDIHRTCVVYGHDEWDGQLPEEIRGRESHIGNTREPKKVATVPILVFAVLLLIGLSVILFLSSQVPTTIVANITLSPSATQNTQPTASATTFLIPATVEVATETATPVETDTLEPTPLVEDSTSELTPTPTQLPTISLAFGSNIRTGPGSNYDVVEYLLPETILVVDGRDFGGRWLHVQVLDNPEIAGWLSILQVASSPLDIAALPTIPTPTLQASPTLSVTPPTLTPSATSSSP